MFFFFLYVNKFDLANRKSLKIVHEVPRRSYLVSKKKIECSLEC